MEKNILEVKNLKTYFYTEEGVVHSVDGLSYKLAEKETLAIVGESGCGKSVSSLSVMGIVQSPPGKVEPGSEILFEGKNLLALSEKEMQRIRGNDISMIFQEPMTSLNPVFTVGQQIHQILHYHQKISKKEARSHAIDMLRLVGIPSPELTVDQYPHQLSGGMRQRVMIAMALSCNPRILIADEPTTALDVTIQAQILRLMTDLKEKLGTAIILITHDMGVVAEMADNVLVMYAGQAIEYAAVADIFASPKHPYTQGLLKSIPKLHEDVDRLYAIKGSVPSAVNFPKGCRFAPRCEKCRPLCMEKAPELYELGDGRKVRCHLYAGRDGN
ncbi:ABC transporter ATP-binding protein [Lacrimispora sp. 210928-DFI.3.58]|uniref:ABC transporter ATP-binding protein n=1 Tax=Lacrimispora sp. 210928-DFI.3.58 TaxID=2883214 RepID=UPI001D07A723|nr:ABC transporter ATP-binding protein [Lacrimispora sp. 210928-DFI.3.58]MCB7317277.1 ABC transporter ATP-binding protein [Lacrimispora sp. 210928-DFI.3.58]